MLIFDVIKCYELFALSIGVVYALVMLFTLQILIGELINLTRFEAIWKNVVSNCLGLLNNLDDWESGSPTIWQSGSLAVAVSGLMELK